MQGNYRVAVRAQNLIKRYGELTAVNDISFDIFEGECFGFLGPNGAGKTSTMKMLSCVSPLNSGELVVHGMDVRRDQRKIKLELGIVSQSDSLDPDLSVLQNLLTYGRYFNMPRKLAQERAWESLRQFHLEEKAYQTIDELSGGMRRRLLIARAMLHDPRILVLDEPTTGLDPQARLLVWDILATLKSRGITILLTTHYMDEAAHLGDRLVVIDQGNVLVEGVPRELVHELVGEQVVELRVNPIHMAGVVQRLTDEGLEFEYGGDSLYFYGDNSVALDENSGLNGYEMFQRPGNLEDLFLRLTGRGLREG
ncbi:MAG: ABC transporter ATP-binding protein [Chloroflexi bacterium]|nr:ABC transporter ATP-binding protein [Chloroflexota bacterium]